MFRVFGSAEMVAMRAGPFWVRFAGSIHASTVISPDAVTAELIFDAGPGVAMSVSPVTSSVPVPQLVAVGVLMVRLSGVPTPDVSATVVPVVSSNS
jgi:hypothetical protein